ncbi:HIT domain-containing protein [Salinadaptatus halalkaliphilus]|uniref:HIT domain-containing protein n=1 Tax=Salinadaptatus halalkaliphilus TaxID=2419781 RepID=A0A4S3TSA8_9EURY|nr:HIT domain-containing protein [Salinadaptatus halalkaliphilus]THE66263.1 HIT domain-containing protein [Salinadaptatus halalkaliphilus]
MSETCTFCQIAADERDAYVLYEDEQTVAFLDESPAAEGHTLVVPRVHEERVLTGDDETARAIFETTRTVSDALERALEPDGFSVFHTAGPLVGSVEHAHVHLVPRFEDDDVALALSRRGLDHDVATTLADRVRDAL